MKSYFSLCFIFACMHQMVISTEAKFGSRFKKFFKKKWRRNGGGRKDVGKEGFAAWRGARITPFLLSDYKQNLTCDDESGFENENLICNHPHLGMENGTWACRSTYHPISGMLQKSTVRVDPADSFISDDCGCCEGECPAPCECPCELEDGEESIDLVLVELTNLDDDEVVQKCIPKTFSATLVATHDTAVCVAC